MFDGGFMVFRLRINVLRLFEYILVFINDICCDIGPVVLVLINTTKVPGQEREWIVCGITGLFVPCDRVALDKASNSAMALTLWAGFAAYHIDACTTEQVIDFHKLVIRTGCS